MSVGEQTINEVTADEAGRAGYQNSHVKTPAPGPRPPARARGPRPPGCGKCRSHSADSRSPAPSGCRHRRASGWAPAECHSPAGEPAPGSPHRTYIRSENVDRIPQIPAHQRQAAVAIVAPADGHLLNAIAQPASQHQDLHIEHISVDLLPAENLPRRRAREKLEAALRVGYSFEAHHRMHEQPEALAAQLPVKRLPPLDLRLLHGARANRHVVALAQRWAQPGPELIELFDGYFVIGVRVTGDVTARQRHRLAHATALPAALLVADHSHRLALAGGFEGQLAGAVAAVGGHDNFIAQAARPEIAACLANGGGDSGGLIVGGQD